jgi:hypothetical protein
MDHTNEARTFCLVYIMLHACSYYFFRGGGMQYRNIICFRRDKKKEGNNNNMRWYGQSNANCRNTKRRWESVKSAIEDRCIMRVLLIEKGCLHVAQALQTNLWHRRKGSFTDKGNKEISIFVKWKNRISEKKGRAREGTSFFMFLLSTGMYKKNHFATPVSIQLNIFFKKKTCLC